AKKPGHEMAGRDRAQIQYPRAQVCIEFAAAMHLQRSRRADTHDDTQTARRQRVVAQRDGPDARRSAQPRANSPWSCTYAPETTARGNRAFRRDVKRAACGQQRGEIFEVRFDGLA